MAQGKLSQQQLQTESPDRRITRTERKQIQTEQKQELRERIRFEQLQAQAKQIQETKFKDKVITEQYFDERPKSFSEYNWSNMEGHLREWHLAKAKKRGEEIIRIPKTRQKTIPFTIDNGENSYSGVYKTLSPDLKPFFQSPEEVREAKTERIEILKTKIQDKFTYADQKIKDRTDYWNNKIKNRQEWWQSKSSSYRDKEGRKKRHKKTLDNYEDDFEEDLAKWQGYKKGLGEAQRKVNQGDELSFSDIESYAYDVGDYYERRKEARNENRNLKQEQQRKIDDLIKQGYKPMLIQKSFKGIPTSSKITFYHAEKKDYAKLDLKLKTTDIGTLPQSKIKTAKISQSFELGGKKFTFETISKVFKKPSGQLTTVFGALGKTESQILQKQRDQIKIQEQEFDKRASQYLETTGFKTDVSAAKTPTQDLTFWQKIKAAYIMTPFGTTMPLSEKYHKLREERTKDIVSITGTTIPKVSLDFTKINTLTWEQSVEAIKTGEKKKLDAEKQIELIEKLSVITDTAPEDIQYYIQAQGISQLAKAGITTAPSKDDPTQIEFSSLDWQPSKSFNLYQWEKSQDNTIKKAILGTRIVSTEALKMYGIGKFIGIGVKSAGYVGGKVYQGLGGGLTYTDITMKGGKATATVTVATGKGSKTLKTIGMGAIGLGIGGLYTYSKVKQYQYSKETFGKAGQEVFFLETGGELLGFGALIKESAVKRADIKKLQRQIQQETYLKEARAESLKNIQKYGKYHKTAKLTYQQAGTGREILSEKGIQSLAKDYSKITGISQREATKMISEKGLYKQIFKVKSSVPSYDRALKFLKTGKSPKIKTQYYETGRYGIFQTQRTAKGSSELAFDFKLHGRIPSNIVLKITQSKDKYAITNIFEKARHSPKDPMKELRLKEIFVTKATKVKTARIGEIKFTQSDIENRLLQQFKPSGKTKLTFKEAMDIGKIRPSKDILKEYWTKAGSLSKSSSFQNIRIQAPLYRGSKALKIAKEGEYLFVQKGIGKAGLPMKTPRLDLLDDALKEIKKQQLRSAIKQSRTARGFKGLDLEVTQKKTSQITSDVGKLIQSKLSEAPLDQTLKNIQISPTIQTSPSIKTAMRLENIPELKDALGLQLATGQASKLKSQTKLKQLLKTKQKVQQDISLKQILRLDLGLKQAQQTKQKTRQIQAPVLSVAQIVENILITPTIKTPTTTPIQTPRIPKIILPQVEKLKRILKQKTRKIKTTETLYYLPDFTSRAIGLDPIEIKSLDQANKLLKKVHTGLEVRRGVRVKIPN